MGLRVLIEEIRGDMKSVKTEMCGLRSDVNRIEADVNDKHRQNRKSIHELRNWIQQCIDKINRVEVKYAGLSVGSGALVAVAIKLIEHYWKT